MNYKQLAEAAGCNHFSIRRWVRVGEFPPPPYTEEHAIAAAEKLATTKARIRKNVEQPKIGNLVRASGQIYVDDWRYIESLPGGISHHLREAAKLYRETLDKS